MFKYQTASPDRYGLMKELARYHRRFPTEAESILWESLRANELGHKFIRQHIIGDYIVDFLCRDDGLVIEVDGGYHNEPEQQQFDVLREQWLVEHGYHVLRFTNEEVIGDIDSVIDEIEKALR